jgi:hypothetical protein
VECSQSRIIARGRFVRHRCSALYVIGNDRSYDRHVVSACQVDNYRERVREHNAPEGRTNPTTLSDADRLFAQCDIGYRFDAESDRQFAESLRETALASQHVLVDARLRASRR